MNYNEALDFIHNTSKIGTKLGLNNIRELLLRLGEPQKKLRFVHVAGTNGKGTVTSTLAEILKKAGYKTGMYTSPFIYDFCERMKVNGKMISYDDLARITSLVRAECQRMQKDGLTHPTEFEIVTAIGLYWFAEQKCDIVMLEVGLGGRLDATNVIDSPEVAVITSISRDHTEYLGDTVEEIAYEKCGIIKPGCSVVIYPQEYSEADSVIKNICIERNCEYFVAALPEIISESLEGTEFSVDGEKYFTTLIGAHMTFNISTAVCAAKLLQKKGFSITEDSIKQGVADVKWSGRFEKISEKPLFIIDGAHNFSAVEALKKAIETCLKGRKIFFITGMLADKEYDKCMSLVAPLAHKIAVCRVPSPRALPEQKLADCITKYNSDVCISPSIEDAVKLALSDSECDCILAFGSLYMLGDVKAAFEKMKEGAIK